MIVALKLSRWKRKNLKLSAWLLNDTRKVISDWKILPPFWRRTEYPRVPERESQKPECLSFYPIRSMSDYLTTQKNYTKVNTSQSFQRNFLMKHRKCYGSVDNLNENHRMNLNHIADSFPVLHVD